MSTQEKFYDLPTDEPPPFNRRVYAAAKLPFAYLWEFLRWASTPWRAALPFALVASFIVNAFANSGALFEIAKLGRFVVDTIEVGLVWTVFLGVLIVCAHVLRALFK